MRDAPTKVTVCFERRPDGGLRVWSEDVPGLVLSHTDVDGVLDDVKDALALILSSRFNETVEVQPLPDLRQALENKGVIDRAS